MQWQEQAESKHSRKRKTSIFYSNYNFLTASLFGKITVRLYGNTHNKTLKKILWGAHLGGDTQSLKLLILRASEDPWGEGSDVRCSSVHHLLNLTVPTLSPRADWTFIRNIPTNWRLYSSEHCITLPPPSQGSKSLLSRELCKHIRILYSATPCSDRRKRSLLPYCPKTRISSRQTAGGGTHRT